MLALLANIVNTRKLSYTAYMTTDPKEAVRQRLREKNMTQAQLAADLGTTPAILSRALGGAIVRQDSWWPKILAALDLEVTVQPKASKS